MIENGRTEKQWRAKELMDQGVSHRKIREIVCEEFGSCSSDTVYKVSVKRKIVSPINDKGKITKKEENGIHEVKYEGGEIITREQFIDIIDFDESSNEVISYQCNLRPVVIRVNSNETKLINKYEHFLRSKPATGFNIEKALSLVNEKIASGITYSGTVNQEGEKLLEICLFDAHINKRSYGGEEWNCAIATKTYLDMVASMITRAQKIDTYKRCLLVIGNDFLNSDFLSKTSSGTPQDNTETEEQSFGYGIEILIATIDMIQTQLECVVDVMSLPGNHAKLLEQILGTTMRAIYRHNDNVSVDDVQSPRKYYTWGNTAIMFSHGDGCKKDKLPMLFANERPDLWGSHRYKQCHLGHIHSKTVDEINGVIIRHLSSITTTDRWHMEQGYVGNRRGGQMFIFDEKIGEEAEFTFYV